jgi:hypothetical protein
VLSVDSTSVYDISSCDNRVWEVAHLVLIATIFVVAIVFFIPMDVSDIMEFVRLGEPGC